MYWVCGQHVLCVGIVMEEIALVIVVKALGCVLGCGAVGREGIVAGRRWVCVVGWVRWRGGATGMRVLLVVAVWVGNRGWRPVVVGQDTGEARIAFDTVGAGWLVASVACLGCWIFAAGVALAHVGLAFVTNEGVETVEAGR